ncbi:MAG: ABC transporter ATP-binding protein [Thermodesulfobacteriota bacterium]
MLTIKDINVYYGHVQALWRVSLAVREGEIVAIVGSNGAGKSTVLRTITGLLKPRAGSIEFDGQSLNRLRPDEIVRLGLSMVPEGRELFPRLTVLENLLLGAAYIEQARLRTDQSLAWVYSLFPRLEERAGQLAGTLSGGEQQMLAIGRALMCRPKILMLDEPSLGLAPKVMAEVFRITLKINQEGVTILLVEQNVRQSLKMAHRAYILENGRIVQEGSGQELSVDAHVKEAYLGL